MGFQVEKNNFISLETLASDLSTELLNNGFQVISVNGQNTDLSIAPQIQQILFKATTAVDPLADDADQPWHIYIVADDENDTLDFYVCTPTNIIFDESGGLAVAISGGNGGNTIARSGFLFKNSQVTTSGTENHFFSYEQWGFQNNDEEAVPLSYQLSITDHGVAFCLWAEAYDRTGNKFGWWVVQRMVDSNTGATILGEKSPLFCVFSHDGGGGTDLNVPEVDGILKFVVRESDINTPTFPVSAVKDTADSARIINSVQQTSIFEDGKFIINFPRSLNTQRYSYPFELDMIAYASADVTSQYAEHEVTVYGEAQPRRYKALQANHENNKGMRIYFQVAGVGLDVVRP